MDTMMSVLADAGCTLWNPSGPPSLPSDPHKLRRNLENRFSDPSLLSDFLSAFSTYIQSPHNLRRLLISSSGNCSDSLVRLLLLVPPLQLHIQQILLQKLPEYFHSDANHLADSSLQNDIPRLILNHFRWLDFLVDSKIFTDGLLEVLSISPIQLKKEIIASLPEIIGDQNNEAVVSALERMLREESEIIVPVLDSFSNLNLEHQLQEQVVTIALSCIRTIHSEHMPHLLRFLLLSATPVNARRIISQIREQLKFVGTSDSQAARQKKLKGKSIGDNAEASILQALSSSLQFKNILCEEILKELKCLDKPQDHKVIDVWLLMLICKNGGSLQKVAKKIIKKKILEGCFLETLFDQCIHGHRELAKDYFPPLLSVCGYLLECKEEKAREFGIHMFTSLFREFADTYSRQEVLGSLVTHIGSGIAYEVNSGLETMTILASKYSKELIPLSPFINGILDYLEGFTDENLHKVYRVFSHLAFSSRANPNSTGSSIANELLMIVRKQVGNPDMKYKRMGLIGTLKIVSSLGDINSTTSLSSSQRTNSDEALDLLKMSLDSCKMLPLLLILLYDELTKLLEFTTLQPVIVEWMGKHVEEFESMFLSDLEGGHLLVKDSYGGLEGELWMNLDSDLSPICLNILPLVASSIEQSSCSLQILPANFRLLSVVERLTNQGSLGGIDALLGCPLLLPSPKYVGGAAWEILTGKQKQIVCISLYYGINWIRELLNAFCTQVAGSVDCITQATKKETIAKLLKRLRNLVCLESLLNASLQADSVPLPELHSFMEHSTSTYLSRHNHLRQTAEKSEQKTRPCSTSSNSKKKRKKNSAQSENSDLNGKLRQPTILDAFKKAGVVSQEVSNQSTLGDSSKGKTSQSGEHQASDSSEPGLLEISAAAKVLDAQRFKFRPLLADSLSILSFSESRDSCCSDPAAELPLHLYLLCDFRYKLEYLQPPRKQVQAVCPMAYKAPPGLSGMIPSEFLSKIRPLFPSLKKHLDGAVSLLRDGPGTCQEHWRTQSTSVGNPDIPYAAVLTSSVASSVFREILRCFSKMLNLPDLYMQSNMRILTDLLEAFQPIRLPENIFSGIQPFPSPGNIDYLYCGTYLFLEGILDIACSFSFLLASEVLVVLESILNSIQIFLDKLLEGNKKNMHVGFIQGVLPLLRHRLGTSAHHLLAHDWGCENPENGWKSKGDITQKILLIYLRNKESTSDLLYELACSVLPQVPSCKDKTKQDVVHGLPTLCPTMIVIWSRVLHEENLVILNKLIKEIVRLEKSKAPVQHEAVKRVLLKLRQSVDVVVSLVQMCKTHDKVTMHAMAVKYGGKFVDSFLKVFNFLQAHFQVHKDVIIQVVKELQKATRTIQTLCSEAKGCKQTTVTSKIPSTKRSMERFLFHVKALLHNTSNGCTFWMGNLKHKDLFGQVVSSQVYANGDDDMNGDSHEQREADLEDQAVSPRQGDGETE